MAEVSKVEQAAMHGLPMPSGLTWREVVEYIALRALYWSHRHDVISRDQASDEKKRLIAALDGAEGSYKFERRCWETAAERYRGMEAAVSAYENDKTIENADKMVSTFYGLRLEGEK